MPLFCCISYSLLSTFFKKKKEKMSSTLQDEMAHSQIDSLFSEEFNVSRVDSVYSSLQSRRSGYRSIASSSMIQPPVHTVMLDSPTIHLSPTINISERQVPPIGRTSSYSSSASSSSLIRQQEIDAEFEKLLVILLFRAFFFFFAKIYPDVI